MALEKWPVRPEWAAWIDAWTTALRAAGRSSSTIAARRQVLAQLSRETSALPADVAEADLLEWMGLEVWDEQLGRLRPRWSVERRRAVRSALAMFFRWAHGTGRVAVDPAIGLPQVRTADALPRPAAVGVYLDALGRAAADEQLMLVLACELGLRRAEVAQVHSRDVVDDLLGTSLIVHGKGGKTRTVAVEDRQLAAQLRAVGGYLFPGRRDGHLSPEWVGRRLSLLLGGTTTMHQLRHLFATVMLREGANIVHVQRTMGHASLATTQRYLYVEDEELRRAVGAVGARLRARPGTSPDMSGTKH